eukprot:scaffold8204_cov248-Pinguiococcus_pyrenoidosus.AAC.1
MAYSSPLRLRRACTTRAKLPSPRVFPNMKSAGDSLCCDFFCLGVLASWSLVTTAGSDPSLEAEEPRGSLCLLSTLESVRKSCDSVGTGGNGSSASSCFPPSLSVSCISGRSCAAAISVSESESDIEQREKSCATGSPSTLCGLERGRPRRTTPEVPPHADARQLSAQQAIRRGTRLSCQRAGRTRATGGAEVGMES